MSIAIYGLMISIGGSSLIIANRISRATADNQLIVLQDRLAKSLVVIDKKRIENQELYNEIMELKCLTKSEPEVIDRVVDRVVEKDISDIERNRLLSDIVKYKATIAELQSKIDNIPCENDLYIREKNLELEKRRIEGEISLAKRELEMREERIRDKLSYAEVDQYQYQRLSQALSNVQSERDILLEQVKALSSQLEQTPVDEDALQIQGLLKSEGIKTEFLRNVNKGGVEIYEYRVLSKLSNGKLEAVAENIPAFLSWVESIPSVSVRKGIVSVSIDTRTVDDRVVQNNVEWLPKMAKTESNLAIFGAKGGGKTELAANYIGLVLKQIPNAVVEWIQPKPEDKSRIVLNSGVIRPSYVGFEDAYRGLGEIINLFQHRNSINTEAFKNDKPIPSWKPVFWIVDEFQSLIAEASKFDYDPKQLCKDIQTAVSLGRSLQINILLIGQIANVSMYPGWTKASYYQFNTVYLGDMIGVGVGYSLTSQEKSEIERQLSDYRKSDVEYYGLVRFANSSGSIYALPKPRKYLATSQQPSATSHQDETLKDPWDKEPPSATSHQKLENGVSECPDCSSTDVKKNGLTKSGKQRYKCRVCHCNFVE